MFTVANVTLRVGRYVLFDEIAAGGMATVHFGRMLGPSGFARTVAIKRLHPQYAKDPEFISMFLDEAQLAARIRHPNVVAMLDVASSEGETLLVMEYVLGAAFSALLRTLRDRKEPIPIPIACAIIASTLMGLHAAHEATGDQGETLHLVHRDVSPQNILVGVDGIPRVADFGIAKAVGRLQTTREGHVKGKSAYMAPEQIRGREVDRRVDVYAAGVVLWEALVGRRLFVADSPLATMNAVLEATISSPASSRPEVSPEIDAIVMRALARHPDTRFSTAREMAIALEKAVRVPSAREIGEWVESVAGDAITLRAARIREIETTPAISVVNSSAEPVDVATENAQISEIEARPRARLSLGFAVVTLLVMTVGVAVVWRSRHSSSVSETAPLPVATPSAAPVSSPSAAPSAAVSIEGPPPRPAEATSAVTIASGSSHPRVVPRPAVTPNTNAARCNPPFTIDATGVRRWKPGC